MLTIYSQFFKILFLIFVASIFIGQIDAGSNALEILEQMKGEHEKKEENFAILQKCQNWNLVQNEQMKTLRKELKELKKKNRKFMELYLQNPIPLINIYEAMIKKKKEELEKNQKNENNKSANKWKKFIPKVLKILVKKKKEIYENVKILNENNLDPLVYAAKFCKNIEKNFPHQRINDATKLCEECQPIALELFKGIYVFNNLEEVPLVLYQEEPAEGEQQQVDTKQGKQQIVHGGNDDEDEASSSNVAFDDEEEENRQKDLQEIDQILSMSRMERQKAKAKKGRKRMQIVREDLDPIDEEVPDEIVEELEEEK